MDTTMDDQMPQQKRKWPYIAFVLLFLWLFALMLSSFISLFAGIESDSLGGNVAIIPVKGVITGDPGSGLFDEGASSEEIVKLIEKADRNPGIRAIIVEINSPGGSPVASDEIAQALKKTNKTTVAWIREIGTSGGYWVASATDHVVANRMSVTGSIGVIASYLDFSGFIGRYNVSYERLVAGKYKDIGTPFKEMTPEERVLFQNVLDDLRDNFIDEVAANRGMDRKDVERLATGLFYLGSEAKGLGLVDELGGRGEAIAYIEQKEGIKAQVVKYKPTPSFVDILQGAFSEQSFHVGQGIGDALVEKGKTSLVQITA
ncbi:MAG: Protease IV [archaeon GW2011_AR11]|nr:MAG: Protease IV [archaeon GW2011_AR11]